MRPLAFESTSLSNFTVLDEGDNLSDHVPIMMSLKTNIHPRPSGASQPNSQRQFKWAKLSDSHKDEYSDRLLRILTSQQTYNPLPEFVPISGLTVRSSHSR